MEFALSRSMHVDYYALDASRFNVEPRDILNIGPVVVITPNRAMCDWKPSEYYFRSLVVRALDGEVISAGFPKFFAYGEVKAEDELVRTALSEARVSWRQKMNGSLILRSVVNDHVYLRTRDSHELGLFKEPVMKLLEKHAPELLDPKCFNDGLTHLFEYCVPKSQIMAPYSKPTLYALARIDHSGDMLKVYDPFPFMSVKSAPLWVMDDEHKTMLATLMNPTCEHGYVLWARNPDDSYHLSKWKTNPSVGVRTLRRLCEALDDTH